MSKRLVRPDYIVFGPQQQVEEIYCKLCGDLVAGFRGEGYQRRFTYFPDYVQFTFDCDDGSKHMTNLCLKCLEEAANDPETLQLLHDADLDILEKASKGMKKFYKDRKALKFSKVDTLGEGKR